MKNRTRFLRIRATKASEIKIESFQNKYQQNRVLKR